MRRDGDAGPSGNVWVRCRPVVLSSSSKLPLRLKRSVWMGELSESVRSRAMPGELSK
jgi:hypothetical protein